MKHLGLFEGIGGFSLAARWMGWETVAWCEWNEYCQRVLKHHFPNAEAHGDITKTDFTKYANTIDILTGGFPCQPFSNAGEMRGKEDDRFLFSEMLRTARETKAVWIVAENVYGITSPQFSDTFEHICLSLEIEGYQVQPYIIPASAIDANHNRDRVWFIAYSTKNADFKKCINNTKSSEAKSIKQKEILQHEKYIRQGWTDLRTDLQQSKTIDTITGIANLKTKPFLFGEPDGFSERLDEDSEQALGNAIVPQVAYQIFKAIEQYESL